MKGTNNYYLFLFIVMTMLVIQGCAQITPGVQQPLQGAADHKLTGHYHEDKFYFFPYGRNHQKEKFLFQALLEGVENKNEVYQPAPEFSDEQNLAIQYDAAAVIATSSKKRYWEYGLVLGKVGRWNDASIAFANETKITPHSPYSWGNIGVCENVIGNFDKSIEAFETVLNLNKNYFYDKPIQLKIFNSSKSGKTFEP